MLKTFTIETDFLDWIPHWWGNWYVIIPEWHPAHWKQYEDIDIDIHGWLTFWEKWDHLNSDGWEKYKINPTDFVYWFDTWGWPDKDKSWVETETERMRIQFETMV